MEKILLLNDSGNFGGVGTIFRNIVTWCDFSNFEVNILFGSNGPVYDDVKKMGYKMDYTQELIKLSTFRELKLLFKFMIKINRTIKSGNYDKVYASGFLSCVLCGVLSYKYKNIKFIWHEHNMPISKIRRGILRILARHIKKILVVSKAIKDNYIIDDDERVVVVYNGIHIDDNNYLNAKSKEELNIAIVSRIDAGKGHLEVIDCFKKISNPKMNLFIIGGASSKESEIIENEIKREEKLNGNIKYIGFTKEVNKYYEYMDVIIQASTKWDSLPTVLIEAMNYNCALIGTNIGGIQEIIDNRNGYIIDKENLREELSEVLKKLSDKEELRRLQSNAKVVLKEKFVLNKQVEEIKGILESI